MWAGLRHTPCREITAGEMNQGLKGVFAFISDTAVFLVMWVLHIKLSSALQGFLPPAHSHLLQPSAPTCLPGGTISKAAAQVSSAHREHGLTAPARGEDKHGFYRSARCTIAVTWKLRDIHFEINLVYVSLNYVILILIMNWVIVNSWIID